MACSDLIKLTQVAGVPPTVRKAKEGEPVIRKLQGLPMLGSIETRVIGAFLSESEEEKLGGWVSGTSLFQSTYTDKPKSTDWDWANSVFLPYLTNGYVESKASTVGHVTISSIGSQRNYRRTFTNQVKR